MDKRHVISLQGREFVTYEGLLELAHAHGLTNVSTTLIQIPSEENGQVAIVSAEVVLVGADGVGRTFTGIGDANPRNVNRNIAAHLIRMAETRGKARAFRDAVNVGMTAWEELEEAGLASEQGAPARAPQGASKAPASARSSQEAFEHDAAALAERELGGAETPPAGSGVTPKAPSRNDPLAGEKLRQQIAIECGRVGWSDAERQGYLLENFGKLSRKDLTASEGAAMLRHLKAQPAAQVQNTHGAA